MDVRPQGRDDCKVWKDNEDKASCCRVSLVVITRDPSPTYSSSISVCRHYLTLAADRGYESSKEKVMKGEMIVKIKPHVNVVVW